MTHSALKVLVVDDMEDNRSHLASLLSNHNLIVETAASGKECLQRYGENFNLILLDIRMPGLDGPETARLLRQMPPGRRACTIVALIARGNLAQLHAAQNAGFEHILEKPVSQVEIDRLILSLMPKPRLRVSR